MLYMLHVLLVHELVTDDIAPNNFTVSNYYIRYLKKPLDIIVNLNTPANQVNCELDDFFSGLTSSPSPVFLASAWMIYFLGEIPSDFPEQIPPP